MATQLEFIPGKIKIKVKKVSNNAKLPTKAYIDDAGWDLYALERTYIDAHTWAVVKTGLAFEIPPGWHIQIHTRSSSGKMGVRCHLGIVDSGYRNELGVIVYNHGMENFVIEKDSKFCQILFLPVPDVTILETDKLNDTDRGQGGFGSSGR
jgi:dUTP pyrophosphatase